MEQKGTLDTEISGLAGMKGFSTNFRYRRCTGVITEIRIIEIDLDRIDLAVVSSIIVSVDVHFGRSVNSLLVDSQLIVNPEDLEFQLLACLAFERSVELLD